MARTVFFLGAGATKSSGGPLVNEFVEAIEEAIDDGEIDPCDVKVWTWLMQSAELQGACENIEVVLQHVAKIRSESERREALAAVSRIIGKTLQRKITFSWNGESLGNRGDDYRLLSDLLRNSTESQHGDVAIITVNYDVCADVAILNAGRRPYYCLNPDRRADRSEIDMPKLHGSLNWIGCLGSGCGYVNAKHHINEVVSREGSTWARSSCHRLEFPEPDDDDRCSRCRSMIHQPLIVPPLTDKSDYVNELGVIWDHARKHLGEAKQLVLVGYSCGEADQVVNDLLRDSGANKTPRELLVANPAPDARKHAQCLIPHSSFREAETFEEAVRMLSSCFETADKSTGGIAEGSDPTHPA